MMPNYGDMFRLLKRPRELSQDSSAKYESTGNIDKAQNSKTCNFESFHASS